MDGKLVEGVEVGELLEDEVRLGDSSREGLVHVRHRFHVRQDLLRLGHVLVHLGALPFEPLQDKDHRVVVQDVPLDHTQLVQQLLLQLPQLHVLLPHRPEDVRPALLNVRPLLVEDLAQHLGLEGSGGDREVHHRDPAAEVRGEPRKGVPRHEQEHEFRGVVDVLVPEPDKGPAPRLLQLLVQDGVQDGVHLLDVVDEERGAEADGRGKGLDEGRVKEGGLHDLVRLVLLENEPRGLTAGVDDEWKPLEPV
mmetsp:Transcript_59373/g.81084  ORF Transcript_59373/g.81084 Transcript_59373/m.81084 type:complete len:251 (-) Transcript_59373:1051-1803(-)